MKKASALLAVLILVLSLAACGGIGENGKTFVGEWSLVGVEQDGEVYDESLIALTGITTSLTLSEDGKMVLDINGDVQNGKWKALDATTVKITSGLSSIQATYADEKLTLDADGSYMILAKKN